MFSSRVRINWRTSQSPANQSPVLNSLLAGNLQGILGIMAQLPPEVGPGISLTTNSPGLRKTFCGPHQGRSRRVQ
jgi:hypothetical protein